MSRKKGNPGRNGGGSRGSGRKSSRRTARANSRSGQSGGLGAIVRQARTLREQGRVPEALELLPPALADTTPDDAARLEMARLKAAAGDPDAAIAWAGEIDDKACEAVNAQLTIGNAYYSKEEFSRAVDGFSAAVRARPDSSVAHSNLANALGELGRTAEAIPHAREAVDLRPDYAPGWSNLGVLLKEVGDPGEAETALRRALRLQPGLIEAERNLVTVLTKSDRYVEARERARALVEAFPESGVAWSASGKVAEELGLPQEAREAYQRAVELLPEKADHFNGYLFALHYNPDLQPEAIHEQYLEWDRRHGQPLSAEISPPAPVGPADRRLRVGLLSSAFRSHPVSFFTLSGLHHLPRDQFELVAFDSGSDVDHVTDLMRQEMTEWHDVGALDDAELAERIRAEKIDILIDLIGHSKGSRLRAIARRPAPVIAKWVGGQLGSIGMEAFDWFITDRYESPPGTEHLYTERLLRLPDDYVCYTPPEYAPDVAELPALKNGHITFACFNKLSKINDRLLETWARILEQVPGARIVFKTKPLDDPAARELVRERFRQVGGDPDALDLRGWSRHVDLLATYNEVDIGLDSWPYSGGLTTCEALWMGVPVVSMAGPTFAGRHSWTHLSNAGLADCLVDDTDGYVRRAVELASDVDALAERRRAMRDHLAASPLCDGPRFARHLADGLRFMWRQALGVPADSERELSAGEETPARSGDEARIRELVRQAEQMLAYGNVDAAGKICLAAMKAAPRDPDVRCLAGLVNLASDRTRDALQHFESALAARPWEPRFNLYTAQALTAAGAADKGEALTEVATRLDRIRDGEAGEALARVMALLAAGETGAGASELRALMKSDPDNQDSALLYSVLNGGDEAGGSGPDAEALSSQSGKSAGDAAALPSEVIEATVNAPDGRELSIAIPRRELFRLRNIFQDEEYALPRGLSPGDVKIVVDVGANVGGFALYARGWGEQVTISCFEPNPQVLGMLEKNLADVTDVRVFPVALGAEEGEITLYQHPRNTGQSSVSQHTHGGRPVPVVVERAEAALAAAGIGRIDVLKIDTEGSEVPILEGMGPFLRRTAVAMLEYHSEADRRRIDELMAGFQLYSAQIMGTSGVGTVKYFNPSIVSFTSR